MHFKDYKTCHEIQMKQVEREPQSSSFINPHHRYTNQVWDSSVNISTALHLICFFKLFCLTTLCARIQSWVTQTSISFLEGEIDLVGTGEWRHAQLQFCEAGSYQHISWLPLSLVPPVTKNSIDKLHFIWREEVTTGGCRESGRTAAYCTEQ